LTQTTHSAIIPLHKDLIMDYKPYSPEWHRKRYLKEALDKYIDDYVENEVIVNDITDILADRADAAYAEFRRLTFLENMIRDEKK
jgi:hypothetical protein